MSPALNGSSAIQRFERSNAIEIRDGITFDFYTGLPHIYVEENLGTKSSTFNKINQAFISRTYLGGCRLPAYDQY